MAGGPIHCQVEGRRTDKKWNSVLDAATEQSRRAFKPQLEACASSKEVVATCRRACVHGDVVIVLHQDATDTWSGVEEKVAQLVERTLQDGRPRTVSVVVGPEGGISEQEVADFVKAWSGELRTGAKYSESRDGRSCSVVAVVSGVGTLRVTPTR